MTLKNVHPGGFFWLVKRGDREKVLLQLASSKHQLLLIADTVHEAERLSERLTLSGVPVFLATDPSRAELLQAELEDRTSTLVATHDFIMAHGPVAVPLVVHLRTAPSVRVYTRRVETVAAAVHLTFVLPEEAARADSLVSYLRNDRGHTDLVVSSLEEVIDLTDDSSAAKATVSNPRRRFPLRN